MIGYGRVVLHKQLLLLAAGIYLLCLILLIVFAGLTFTGTSNDYYWVQQAIDFRKYSPFLSGDIL